MSNVDLSPKLKEKIDEWLPIGFLVLLLILVGFSTISNAKNYDVSYNGSVAYVTYNNNGKPYATVELINNLTIGADGKFHFEDCGDVMCLAKIQVNASDDIVFNKHNIVDGFVKYNQIPAAFNQLYVLQDGSWHNINLSNTAILARAGSSVVFGLEFYRSDGTETMDLVPRLFGNDFDRWAWWDAYQPASNATGNVVNITACGTYAQNNTVFQLTANITAGDEHCLIFTGNNITFNGMWNTLTSTNNGAGSYRFIQSGGNLQRFENVSIFCSGASNTVRAITANANTANSTYRFIRINGCNYGFVVLTDAAWGTGNSITSMDLRNITANGVYQAAAAVNPMTITNINADSPTADEINILAGAGTPVNGGSNYWTSCSGTCAWYSITTTNTGVLATYDAPTYSTSPTTNYGTATSAHLAVGVLSSDIFYQWNNATQPPGMNLSAVRFTNYIAGTTAGLSLSQTAYTVNAAFNESTVIWNTKPADGVAAAVACTTTTAKTCNEDWTSAGLISQQTFRATLGTFVAKNLFSGVGDVGWIGDSYTKEHATAAWRPYLNYTWRPAIYDAPVSASQNINGYTYTIKQALATNGSTYCSFSTSTVTPAVSTNITNSITLAAVSMATTYNSTKNATHKWVTFPCTQNTFYTMEEIYDWFYVTTNNASCATSYSPVATYTIKDESTGSNSSANVTVYFTTDITGLVTSTTNNSGNFTLCKHTSSPAFNANITTIYSNMTSTIRSKIVPASLPSNLSVTLYTLAATSASYYTFYVTSSSLPVEDASINVYRYISGAWVNVDQGTTDFMGYTAMSLQAWYPYLLTVTATGYTAINTTYTPTTITLIPIQMFQANGTMPELPGFESIWNSTAYSVSPSLGYHAGPVNITFQVIDLNSSSAIEYYGWNVTCKYNNTNTTWTSNITTPSNSGLLNVSNYSGPGQCRVDYWFKRTGYSEFRSAFTIYVGASVGLSLGGSYLAGVVSPWAYIFVAVVIAMIVGGFVSRYTVDGASISGIIVLTAFMIMWPGALLIDPFINFFMIWLTTVVVVSVALAYKWVL